MRFDKELIKEIDRLIQDDGHKSYDSLNDMAKEDLVIIAMDCLGEDAYTAVIEVDDLAGMLSDIKGYIATGGIDEAVNLAETIKKNAIKHFESCFEELFIERFNGLQCEINREDGLVPIVDSVNGETRWVK
jgi:hypothetical protein